MATFGEMIYGVLDLLKEKSDDAFFTEEHVKFLLSKMRATLLERKYKGSRNSAYQEVSDENKQQVCLSLSPASLLPAGCAGHWLRSDQPIPQVIDIPGTVACTGHDLLETNVTFIPEERMRYVGHNRWLRNIIYAARSVDGHLYLTGLNPQMMYLEQAGLTGVFSDPEAAAKMSHEACLNGGKCDIMNTVFPLEASLVAPCIELVLQELSGPRYAPEDRENNAKDDLGEAALTRRTAETPANEVSNSRQRESE